MYKDGCLSELLEALQSGKKGDTSSFSNYRPISILSNFAKLFECVLYKQVNSHVTAFISPDQHGFVGRRSTVTNLCTLAQYVGETLDRCGQVDVIYTDFSRAFDTVNHSILLQKLALLGFSPSAVQLLQSYLLNRVFYVSYNGYSSDERIASAGVPQGSNLGPLLFSIFINDLLLVLNCPVLAYADDIKIYSEISSLSDALHLQTNLNKIAVWCQDNKLTLNVTKCAMISYTRKNFPLVTTYSVDNYVIERKYTVVDLGVIFDCKFTFVDHIDSVCASASKSLGFVMRVSKHFQDIEVLKILYTAYVLSKLEYACIVWYPIYVCHCLSLDRIHRRFLKYLSFKMDGVYPEVGTCQDELLQRHGMQPLSVRRDAQCVQFIRKMIRGEIDCMTLLSGIAFRVPRLSSRHESTFNTATSRTNALQRSPLTVMCRLADRCVDDIFI